MRKKLLSILVLLGFFLCSYGQSDSLTFTDSVFTYEVVSSGEVKVTCTDGFSEATMELPETVTYDDQTYTVVENGDFSGNYYYLKELILPKTLKRIDVALLTANMNYLVKVKVDSDNPYFTDHDGCLYSKDMKTLWLYPTNGRTGTLTLPEVDEIMPRAIVVGYDEPRYPHFLVKKAFRFTGALSKYTFKLHLLIPSVLLSDEEFALNLKKNYSSYYFCYDIKDDATGLVYKLLNDTDVSVVSYFSNLADGGNLAIPSTVVDNEKTYRVTTIDQDAFYGASISKVTLPGTLTKIGYDAFYNCDNLVLVDAHALSPDSVNMSTRAFSDIAKRATLVVSAENTETFRQASGWNEFMDYVASDLYVDGVFYRQLTDSTVEAYRCEIGKTMSLPDEITIGDKTCRVTSIAPNTFRKKSKYGSYDYSSPLEKIRLPQYLESIGDSAFYYTHLTEVELPATISKIGTRALKVYNGSNFTTIFKGIGTIEFCEEWIYRYSTIYVMPSTAEDSVVAQLKSFANKVYLCDALVDHLLYRKTGDATVEVFKCLEMKEELTIPDEIMVGESCCRVTGISDKVFYVSSSSSPVLKKIHLPNYLETIGSQAFYNNLLMELTIPASVNTIGDQAFMKFATLAKDDNGTYVWQYAPMIVWFENASQLQIGSQLFGYDYNYGVNFNYNEEVRNLSIEERQAIADQFTSTPKVNKYMVKPYRTPTTVVNQLKNYASALYLFDVIDDQVLYRQRSNGTLAYMLDTKGRTDVVVPANITSGDGTSYSVTMIDADAFSSTTGRAHLKTLYLPASIDSLGTRSIYGNEDLQSIICDAITPPAVDATGFSNYDAWLKVNADAMTDYKSHAIWSKFKMQIGDFAQGNISYSMLTENTVAVVQFLTDGNSALSYVIPDSVYYKGQPYAVTETADGVFTSISGDVLVLPRTLEKLGDGFGSFKRIYLQSPTPPVCNNISIDVFILRDVLNNYMVDTNFWDMVRYRYTAVDGINSGIIYQLNDGKATAYAWTGDQPGHNRIIIPSKVYTDDGSTFPVTTIGRYFLYYHGAVGSLKLPPTITTIENYSLPQTSIVICAATNPPSFNSSYHKSSFSSSTLYVKTASLSTYKSTSYSNYWRNFGSILPYDEADGTFLYSEENLGELSVKALMDKNMKQLIIPDSVFTDDERLLPVVALGKEAFAGNTTITDITLPTTLKQLGEKSLYRCTGITSLTLPPNLSKIGSMALGYTKIQSFNTDGNQYFKVENIDYHYSWYESVREKALYTANGDTLIKMCMNSYTNHDYEIPDGVKTIAAGAFNYCNRIYNLILPASVEKIENLALTNCSMDYIKIADSNSYYHSVDGFLYNADTTMLVASPNITTEYEIPLTVMSIGEYALSNAYRFYKLTLPEELQYISPKAFSNPLTNTSSSSNNSSLVRIDTLMVLNSQPISLDYQTLYPFYQTTVLHVPVGTSTTYCNTYPWNKFQQITSSTLGDIDYAILKAFYEEMGNGEGWKYQWTLGDSPADVRGLHGLQIREEHIVVADLSGYGLKGQLSSKIFNLSAMKSLNLSRNQLDFSIDSLMTTANVYNGNLKDLDISYNKIRGNLGAVCGSFPALTTLNANNNQLSDVKPTLPKDIKLNIRSQTLTDTIEYSQLLMTANLPSILTYNHNGSNYNRRVVLRLSGDYNTDYFDMKLRQNSDILMPIGNNLFSGINGSILIAKDSASYHSIPIRMTFESGDANFDTKIDVVDLQAIINYAINYSYNGLFNFTAADIVADDWVNVQDVISQVNILLDKDINTEAAATRSLHTDNAEPDALLYWRGNELILASSGNIAAIDLIVSGENNLNWCLNGKEFDCTKRSKNGQTHIIHCSLSGRSIDAGEVVLATVSGEIPEILNVNMATSDASHVYVAVSNNTISSVSDTTPQTGLTIRMKNQHLMVNTFAPVNNLRWEVCMLNGTRLDSGEMHAISAGQYELPCRIPRHTQVIVRIVADNRAITKNIMTN